MTKQEEQQAREWKYGLAITRDDVLEYDFLSGRLRLTDAAFARFMAGVMVEASDAGMVLMDVASLPPVTELDVQVMQATLRAHLGVER